MIAQGARTSSEALYQRAQELMPGGVNSPVRAFRAVSGSPLFFEKASGARLTDVEGREYIDYVCSWGAVITGHADPAIVSAVSRAAQGGTSFGAPHPGEIALAEEIVARVPGLEMVRFVNSGTEATTAAIRLARAATGRAKVIKFEGNYHGAVDALLAKAGSGVATFSLPDSAGIPEEATRATLLARYNDAASVERLLVEHRGEVAAVIVEPVAGNMGCVPPQPGFLRKLREICSEHRALLIFDEVMTGFRVARGGAQELFGISADLVCMGKVIGGGLPVGAYGGTKELMRMIAPAGPVYQAGTLSGNPLAMAAGIAALASLNDAAYSELESRSSGLESGLKAACGKVRAQIQRVGSMISVFFNAEPVVDFDSAQRSDREFFGKLFHALLKRGVYLPPSALESWFLTTSHSRQDIQQTCAAFAEAIDELA